MKLIKLNKIFVFFLILFLFKPTWILNLNSLGDDELSYWLHSATLAFDFDIDYKDDYKVNDSWTFNRNNVPSHPPGSGYIHSIFVFLFDLFFEKDFDKNIDRLNPVGSFWMIGYFFSTLFYVFFGFNYLSKALQTITKDRKLINFVLFLTFLSTLSNYVLNRFMLSHSVEFFLVSLIIYAISKQNINIYLLASLYFLLSITRPSTFAITLFLLVNFGNNVKRIKFNYLNISYLMILLSIYIYLSKTLYNSFFIFLNTYKENPIDSLFNDASILEVISDLPSLLFSPSMGIMFISPIIFLSIILMVTNYRKVKIIELLIILLGIGVVLIWQGKDVTFGQRFLIGQLPVAAYISTKYYKNKFFINIYMKLSLILAYLGNLYFYSSEALNLNPGKNLFGQYSQLSAENYFINLIFELTDINVHFSMLSRTIFFVLLVKVIDFQKIVKFVENILFLDLSEDKYTRLFNYVNSYEEYSNIKFFILIFSLILFSYLMAGIFTKQTN